MLKHKHKFPESMENYRIPLGTPSVLCSHFENKTSKTDHRRVKCHLAVTQPQQKDTHTYCLMALWEGVAVEMTQAGHTRVQHTRTHTHTCAAHTRTHTPETSNKKKATNVLRWLRIY